MPLVPVLLRWLLSVLPTASISSGVTTTLASTDAAPTSKTLPTSAAGAGAPGLGIPGAAATAADVVVEKPLPPPGWRWRSEADAAAAGVAIADALVECLLIPPSAGGAQIEPNDMGSSGEPAAAAAAAVATTENLPPPPPLPYDNGATAEAGASEAGGCNRSDARTAEEDEVAQTLVLVLDVVAAVLRAVSATNTTSAATVRLLSRLVECAALATNHLAATVLPSLEPAEFSSAGVHDANDTSGSASGSELERNHMRAAAANALAELLSAALRLEGAGVFATVRVPVGTAPNETSAAAAATPVTQEEEPTNDVDGDSDSSDWDASDDDDENGDGDLANTSGLISGGITPSPCLWTSVLRTLVRSGNRSVSSSSAAIGSLPPSPSSSSSSSSSTDGSAPGTLLEEACKVLPVNLTARTESLLFEEKSISF